MPFSRRFRAASSRRAARVIDDRSGFFVGIAVGQNRQLFFCSRVLSGKTEQLKEESALGRVRRMITQVRRERLHCFSHFSGLEQLFGRYWHRSPACLPFTTASA